MPRVIDPKDQPDLATKLATLRGEDTGWDYQFQVTGPSPGMWTHEDWIRYIGDQWFRTRPADSQG